MESPKTCLALQNSHGHSNFFKICRQFEHAPSKSVPALVYGFYFLGFYLMSLLLSLYLLTYLLHGAESFLRSYPVNFAASQEIPRIYGTRKSLTVPTNARHLSLS